MTKTIDRREFEQSPGRFLDLAVAGNEVVITEQDRVRARLTGVSSAARQAGLHRDAVEMSEDFDSPLPDEFWLGSDR